MEVPSKFPSPNALALIDADRRRSTDVSLDAPLGEVLDHAGRDPENQRESPRWLRVLVGDGGVPGQEVWVRFFADEAPPGRPAFATDPPRPGIPNAWVVSPVEGPPITKAKRSRKRDRSLIGTDPLPADAYIDQWSGLLPKEVFLRLASQHHFPVYKKGHLVLAKWGDVQAALASLMKTPEAPLDPEEELRARLGLASHRGG